MQDMGERRSYTRGEMKTILMEWFRISDHPMDVSVMADWLYDRGAEAPAACRRCGRIPIVAHGLCMPCVELMQHND
ncbi:hypothetical protein [Bifidobacterium sp. SO1]|uniref:hypothetical protein n=1 Tax=Bifidobacterium sp. SO1 TaxID=2809029 RepID=UPI001BDC9F98|nr:hypothetical protein [Bifidobacterium sp. SO1]MBT1162797.1 hypothetical protein [Bifidobacterium sp. SO1]